jgi:DNA/RNA endonuclease YhcR with UshA esterase domain
MTDEHRPSTLLPAASLEPASPQPRSGQAPRTGRPGSSSECPSCGRFVGSHEKCPYCGTDVGQRIAVRVFKYGSLVVAILGLAVLLFAASRNQVPRVEIGDLAGTMNWAYVHVEGLVSRQPLYDPVAKTLKFWVWDETGEIMISAYRSEAEWMLAEGAVPVMGDYVALEGTLRVKEDFQYLVLNVPQSTNIWPPEPLEMNVSGVEIGLLYKRVTVRGIIRQDRTPYDGLRILTLRDATGEIDVTLAAGTTVGGGEFPDLGVGLPLQVTGAVDQYQGVPQISIGRGSDLVVLEEPIAIAPARHIAELSVEDVGDMALVQGTIASVNPFSAGVKFTVDDGSGTVTLLLWQDVYEELPDPQALVKGTTVCALGEVSQFQGELEIVPELPADVTVAVGVERIVPQQLLGALTGDDVGRIVRVEGVLKSLRTFSAGVKGRLEDGTGMVTLLLWQDVYDGLPDAASLAPGAVLGVEGEVSVYKDELEVVPLVPSDVTVMGFVELPSKVQAIGRISVDDVGQTVRVAGQISVVTPFSQGVKCTLDDGTGTVALLLWQDLFERLNDPATSLLGAQVSVRGEVAEYKGELEIVPQVPADVEVTAEAKAAAVLSTAAPPTIGPTVSPTGTPEPASTSTLTPTPKPTTQPTPSPTLTPSVETRAIGAITTSEVGHTFTIVKAGIAGVSYFSSGVKYTLTDSTGSIILLVWQNVMEEIPSRYDLTAGSQVRVTGEIEEYQGDLEIIPQEGSGVVVISPGARPPIEQRPVHNITPSDEGRIFAVEGRVTRTESRKWLKLWIHDGAGEILIFVPQRTVEYLPLGIDIGVRLRVTGEVDIYQSVIEIIPLAGADVEVQ